MNNNELPHTEKQPKLGYSQIAALAGRWQGITRTWLEPGKLADESTWEATLRPVLSGKFLLYEYTGAFQGQTLEGIALVGYSPQRQAYEMAWIDSFHTNSAIMLSVGEPKSPPFEVLGSYPDPEGGPAWGWRTTLSLADSNQLVARHFNITPQGDDVLAVETIYQRK